MVASPPGSFMRLVYKVPVLLYDHDLGGLLGRRFLCLTHVGRWSGRRYRTVLEVVASEGDEYLVISGFGHKSDWYRNIHANPAAEVAVGGRSFAASYRDVEGEEAVAVLAGYERRYRWSGPVIRWVMSHFVGWPYDGSDAARRRLAAELPIVAFRPASP